MRLLPGTLALHDVRDVEGLCRAVLDRVLREWGAHLRQEQWEDALRFLVGIAWAISGVDDRGRPRTAWVIEAEISDDDGLPIVKRVAVIHDQASADARLELIRSEFESAWVRESTPPPGCYRRDLGPSFSTFASRILARRVVDWYRKEFGDSRYGRRPQTLSLDAIAATTGVSIADLIGPDPYLEEEEVLTRVHLAG